MFKFRLQKALGIFISALLMGPAFDALFNVKAITLIAFVGTLILFTALLVHKNKIYVHNPTLIFMLLLTYIITIFQNMFLEYIPQIPNGMAYLTLNITLFLLLFVTGTNKTIDGLFDGLRVFGILLGLLLILPIFFGVDYRAFYPAGFGVWLTLGLATGMSSTAWLSKLDYEIINNNSSLRTYAFTTISLLGVLCSLGRGALLFISLLTVGLFIRLLIYKGSAFVLIRFAPLFVVLLGILATAMPQMQIDRLLNLFGPSSDVGARTLIYLNVLTKLPEMSWHGFGIGYFFPFPHNFALHFFSEVGLVGIIWIAVFYIAPLFYLIKSFFSNFTSVTTTCSFYLICFLLLEFSKSHNAYNARALFLGCAVLFISHRASRSLK